MKIEKENIKELFVARAKNVNKYDFGIVGLMGGSLRYSGAIKLALMSLAAMRSGCGISRIIIDDDIAEIIAPLIVEQTLWILHDDLKEAIANVNVLAIGMGWSTTDKHVQYMKFILNNYSGKLIIDADGINILAKNKNWLKTSLAQIVLTPHLQEFARLTGIESSLIAKNPLKYAKEFAQKYRVILLLKGNESIITDGKVHYFVSSGNPGMATAGSGDVLSGIIAGFLAYNTYQPLNVAAACYMAGLAGTLASQKYTDIAMIASDTIEFIPEAIKMIRKD